MKKTARLLRWLAVLLVVQVPSHVGAEAQPPATKAPMGEETEASAYDMGPGIATGNIYPGGPGPQEMMPQYGPPHYGSPPEWDVEGYPAIMGPQGRGHPGMMPGPGPMGGPDVQYGPQGRGHPSMMPGPGPMGGPDMQRGLQGRGYPGLMPGPGPIGGAGMMHGRGVPAHPMMGGGRRGMTGPLQALWAPGLTEDQRSQLREIAQELRKKHWALKGSIMEEYDKLAGLYAVETVDASAVGEVYGQIFDLQRQMIEASIDAQNRANAVLTPEQKGQVGYGTAAGPEGQGPAEPGISGSEQTPQGESKPEGESEQVPTPSSEPGADTEQ